MAAVAALADDSIPYVELGLADGGGRVDSIHDRVCCVRSWNVSTRAIELAYAGELIGCFGVCNEVRALVCCAGLCRQSQFDLSAGNRHDGAAVSDAVRMGCCASGGVLTGGRFRRCYSAKISTLVRFVLGGMHDDAL